MKYDAPTSTKICSVSSITPGTYKLDVRGTMTSLPFPYSFKYYKTSLDSLNLREPNIN